MEIGSKPQQQITASGNGETTASPGIILQPLEQRVRLPDGREVGMSEYVDLLGRSLLESNKRVEQLENYLRAGQGQQQVSAGGSGLLQQLIATGGQIASAVAQGFAHSGNDEMSKMAFEQFKATHQLFMKKILSGAIP